jgi:Flp pilus assembly protein TadG
MKNGFPFLRFLKDRGGNFGMMTAILLPVTLGVGGVSMDLIRALELKNQMQAAVDAGALAAASAMASKDMTEAEASALANSWIIADFSRSHAPEDETPEQKAAREAATEEGTQSRASTTETNEGEFFDITTNLSYAMPLNSLTRLLGKETISISVTGTARSARQGNALSMYLVLDESGSMADYTTTVNPVQATREESYPCKKNGRNSTCYRTVTNYLTKMESLKAAASALFIELLKAADPKTTNTALQRAAAKELIRVGAVSYTHETKTAKAPQWGTEAAEEYVEDLPKKPEGGTDSSGAMTVAYNALKKVNSKGKDNTEIVEHAKKNNYNPARFIVLMTDGQMTGYSNKWNSTLDKATRKVCEDAKKDEIIIFSVAFMAPENGKSLLEACATDKDSYFEPEDMEELVAAFGDIARKASKSAARLTN